MGWCVVHTHVVYQPVEWPLGPVCLGTVWVGTVEWVWPSRADGCFSVNTWNKLGGSVMVHLVHLVRMPPTISGHLRLRLPTLWCHSDAHCISSHNHTTPVAGLNSDQCLISPDLVPMSQAAAYLSFSPYATGA